MNWREIEAELVEIAKHDECFVTQNPSGDSCLDYEDCFINLSDWAKALADRLNAKPVVVKSKTPLTAD